ncbi:MAG TPA: RagB/SusD family nutrient uptake outer membrane protein [Chryseosolibacter sp.]
MKFSIKIKSSALVFLSVFSAGLFSCETDLLELRPVTSLDEAVVFDTPSRVELQVNNMYTQVKSGQFFGGRYQIYGDIRANDFINRTTNGVTGYLVWQHTITETSQNDVVNLWDAAYNAINQINLFLDGLDANQDKFTGPLFVNVDPDYTNVTAVRFRAEARFLRALCYHSLLQLYAAPYTLNNGASKGLPLRLQGEKDLLNNDLPRSTVAEVYTQILADLDYAEQNLPLTYGSASLRTTRAHKNSAIALKTRVYLTMGNYAAVITEANKIVPATAPFTASSGVPHALQASISSVFAPPQETAETILGFPFTAQNTPGTQNQLGFYYRAGGAGAPNAGGGEYSLNLSGIVAANPNFPASDARRGFFYVFPTTGTTTYLGKYPSGTPYLDKAPVMRWSEVLLNLSEAIARTTAGVDTRALALLNAVRRRSDASFTWAPADNAALIDAILLERRIEFLGEGIRNMDIMRLNQSFPAKGAVPALAPTSGVYIWPIPATELQTNALMERN